MKAAIGSCACLLLSLCLACSDLGSAGPTGPPPADLPVVTANPGFGDPRLMGELVIQPVSTGPEAGWAYRADVDGDGEFESSGVVDSTVRLPYGFDAKGVHLLHVRFERAGRRFDVERPVVVNDPDATRVVDQIDLPEVFAGLEGIVADDTGTLYVSDGTSLRLYRLSTNPLALEKQIQLPQTFDGIRTGVTEGLALAAGNQLVAVHKEYSISVLSTPDLDVLGHYEANTTTFPEFFVVPEPSGNVVIGKQGVARLDPSTGEVLRDRKIVDGWNFALSPDGQAIAELIRGSGPFANGSGSVTLLRAQDFASAWTTDLAEVRPWAAQFGPGGRLLYVFGTENYDADRLVVLDVATGEILKDIRLGSDPLAGQLGVANPSVVSSDGRFIVFSSRAGAYLVDTESGLPAYRTEPASGCCNVATGADPRTFYFDNGAQVVEVRVAAD